MFQQEIINYTKTQLNRTHTTYTITRRIKKQVRFSKRKRFFSPSCAKHCVHFLSYEESNPYVRVQSLSKAIEKKSFFSFTVYMSPKTMFVYEYESDPIRSTNNTRKFESTF